MLEFICYCLKIVTDHWLPQYNVITLAGGSKESSGKDDGVPVINTITGVLQTTWGSVLETVTLTLRLLSISSPLSYPEAVPAGYSFLEDTREGAWSSMWDPRFPSPPCAPQSPPSLYGSVWHEGSTPGCSSGAGNTRGKHNPEFVQHDCFLEVDSQQNHVLASNSRRGQRSNCEKCLHACHSLDSFRLKRFESLSRYTSVVDVGDRKCWLLVCCIFIQKSWKKETWVTCV